MSAAKQIMHLCCRRLDEKPLHTLCSHSGSRVAIKNHNRQFSVDVPSLARRLPRLRVISVNGSPLTSSPASLPAAPFLCLCTPSLLLLFGHCHRVIAATAQRSCGVAPLAASVDYHHSLRASFTVGWWPSSWRLLPTLFDGLGVEVPLSPGGCL